MDADTGTRGFLLTGEERYLEPYRAAREAIARADLRIKSLVTTETRLAALRERIEALGLQRMAALEAAIAARREHSLDDTAEMFRRGPGKELMDNIRQLAAQLDAELDTTLTGLLTSAEERLAFTKAVTLFTHLVIAGALIGLFFSPAGTLAKGKSWRRWSAPPGIAWRCCSPRNDPHTARPRRPTS